MRCGRRGISAVCLMAAICLPLCACARAAGSCTPLPGDLNGNGSNEEYLIGLLAVLALFAVWRFLRRK